MRSQSVHVVLSLGRPDPDRLSTTMLWSLIAHAVLLAGAITVQMLPSAPSKPGEPHFVTLAAPGRPAAGGGGGRTEPEPSKPPVVPPPPKEPAAEPPAPPVHAPTKASLPSDKPPKPAPPSHTHETPPVEGAHDEHPHEDPAAGSGATGSAPGVPGGAPGEPGVVGGTSFGEGDFRFGWYQTAIESKLQSSWRRPAATTGDTQTATVSFTILRNGAVRDVQVVTPSENPAMDLSVIRAVYDATPLPPLPRGWAGDSVHVSIEFSLKPSAP